MSENEVKTEIGWKVAFRKRIRTKNFYKLGDEAEGRERQAVEKVLEIVEKLGFGAVIADRYERDNKFFTIDAEKLPDGSLGYNSAQGTHVSVFNYGTTIKQQLSWAAELESTIRHEIWHELDRESDKLLGGYSWDEGVVTCHNRDAFHIEVLQIASDCMSEDGVVDVEKFNAEYTKLAKDYNTHVAKVPKRDFLEWLFRQPKPVSKVTRNGFLFDDTKRVSENASKYFKNGIQAYLNEQFTGSAKTPIDNHDVQEFRYDLFFAVNTIARLNYAIYASYTPDHRTIEAFAQAASLYSQICDPGKIEVYIYNLEHINRFVEKEIAIETTELKKSRPELFQAVEIESGKCNPAYLEGQRKEFRFEFPVGADSRGIKAFMEQLGLTEADYKIGRRRQVISLEREGIELLTEVSLLTKKAASAAFTWAAHHLSDDKMGRGIDKTHIDMIRNPSKYAHPKKASQSSSSSKRNPGGFEQSQNPDMGATIEQSGKTTEKTYRFTR